MRDNIERFIESNTENSWLQYINNMSLQGTSCDYMIIQAVADQFDLKIIIAETQEGFAPFSIVLGYLQGRECCGSHFCCNRLH